MRYDLDAMLLTDEAAEQLSVSVDVIRQWARRGLIRPRYRLRDLLAAEKATRTARRLDEVVDQMSH